LRAKLPKISANFLEGIGLTPIGWVKPLYDRDA
jgi:hypothetical protein